jgi:hypothetical protein
MEVIPLREGCPDVNSDVCNIPVSVLLRAYRRNRQNCLYPFATVLPDGNLFMFVGQFSAILDTSSPTFDEIEQMPTILDFPGQDESEAHSRGYPGSGSAVILPLDPASGYKAKILVCGGSTADRGPGSMGLSTCGMIEPLSANPVWEYSRMIRPRVMLDIILLPNEEVLIINGANSGEAVYLNFLS